MNPMLTWLTARSGREIFLKSLVITAAAVLFLGWLWFTPPGVMGKADAVGYAVCHRISVRSFFIGERQFPLCARCSGMYLGALVGLLYYARFPGRAGMPVIKVSAVLAAFLLVFGVDGVNSYLHLFPGFTGIYQPTNLLRLLTGTGVGLGIAAVLVPVLRQTLWKHWDPAPVLHSWKRLAVLLGLAGLVDLLILSGNPLLLYPLALLSSGTILAVLSLIYTIIWTMITRRENAFTSWKQLWPLLTAGFATAVLQIAAMDAVRFWLTGTWEGFIFS